MKRMKHIFRILSLMALPLAFTACGADDTPEAAATPINLSCQLEATATIDKAATRAGTTLLNQFQGEEVRAFFTAGSTVASAYYTTPSAATGALSLVTTGDHASTQPYYKADGTDVDLYVIHPASADGSTFGIQADQSGETEYLASDLMWAGAIAQNRSANAIALTFSHLMAKVVVKVAAGDGLTDADITKVELLNISRTASVSVSASSGSATGSSDVGPVVVANSGSESAALIPPQQLSGEFIQVTTSKGTLAYSLAAASAFTAGLVYSYNLTVSAKELVVDSFTITDWGAGTSGGTVDIKTLQ